MNYLTETKTDFVEETTKNSETQMDVTLSLLFTAVERNMNVETIEKLLNMRETLRKEHARQEFIKALTNFQAEVPEITKDQAVFNKDGTIRYRYASLDKIISTIKPYLAKNGLSYRFETSFEGNAITIHCIIQHVLGHSEVTSFKIPIDSSTHMSEIQRFGSTITYARRYSLCLALGLVTDEDTDANIETTTEKENTEEKEITEEEKATEKQLNAIFALLKNKTREERLQIVSSILGREITTSKELTKKEASKIIDTLKNDGLEPF
ncbi:MAG: ERF family protein [Thermodesulfovibrio sp.]